MSNTDIELLDMLMRLAVALGLGALIGLERETQGRPAGLRTHILVCFGATLFTLCSYQIAGNRFDPGRVTAQIVTGIGFLGAGTIMRQGSIIRGLTTAASIWTVAAIGVSVGIGREMLLLAVISSFLVFGTLRLLPILERHTLYRGQRILLVELKDSHESLCNLFSILQRHDIKASVVSSQHDETVQIRVAVHTPQNFDENKLEVDLSASNNVISYYWE